jgi:N-acetylneuraminic acid mutarotase
MRSRFRSLLPSALALSAALAACSDETTTEPSAAVPSPTAPALAIASNTWITRANMPANRTDLAAATVKNAAGQSIVYAIGGLNTARHPVKTVTAYNVATNTWTFSRPLPVAVASSNGAGVINGKIYISGGYSDYGENFPNSSLYMYDPATNTWTRKRDMPAFPDIDGSNPVVGADGVTGVINGKLYVVTPCFWANEPWGYYEGCGEQFRTRFFRYNPVTDRWTTLDSPFEADASGPYEGGVIDGKFYVMWGSMYTREGRFAVYDPATNRWTRKTPLGLARPGAATAVQDAKLFVMGGTRYNAPRDTFEALDITIVYDPMTDAWTRRASMPSPRTGIAGIKVFLNGQARIEVLGGVAPGNNLQYIP